MADRVQQLVEATLPELEHFEKKQTFTKAEIRVIVARRTAFEYKLQRRPPLKEHCIEYINYEKKLEKLRALRKERSGDRKMTRSDFSIVKRVIFLYERTVRLFSDDVALWLEYIDFCKQQGGQQLGKVFARALQLHATEPEFWIRAAQWEFETNSNMEGSRMFFQRGLRFNPTSDALWLGFIRTELQYIKQVRERRRVLGLESTENAVAAEASDPLTGEATTLMLTGAVPRTIYDKAIRVKDLEDDLSFRSRVLELLKLPHWLNLREHVLSTIARDFPLSPSAWILRAVAARERDGKEGSALTVLDEGLSLLGNLPSAHGTAPNECALTIRKRVLARQMKRGRKRKRVGVKIKGAHELCALCQLREGVGAYLVGRACHSKDELPEEDQTEVETRMAELWGCEAVLTPRLAAVRAVACMSGPRNEDELRTALRCLRKSRELFPRALAPILMQLALLRTEVAHAFADGSVSVLSKLLGGTEDMARLQDFAELCRTFHAAIHSAVASCEVNHGLFHLLGAEISMMVVRDPPLPAMPAKARQTVLEGWHTEMQQLRLPHSEMLLHKALVVLTESAHSLPVQQPTQWLGALRSTRFADDVNKVLDVLNGEGLFGDFAVSVAQLVGKGTDSLFQQHWSVDEGVTLLKLALLKWMHTHSWTDWVDAVKYTLFGKGLFAPSAQSTSMCLPASPTSLPLCAYLVEMVCRGNEEEEESVSARFVREVFDHCCTAHGKTSTALWLKYLRWLWRTDVNSVQSVHDRALRVLEDAQRPHFVVQYQHQLNAH